MNDIKSTIAQYEADADKIAAKIDDVKRRLHNEKDPKEYARLLRMLPVLEAEYYELLNGIRAMRRYLEPKKDMKRPRIHHAEKKEDKNPEQACGGIYRKCKNCGREFMPNRGNQVFCDTVCRYRYENRLYSQRRREKKKKERNGQT